MEIAAASTRDLSSTSCCQLFSRLEILSALLQGSCSPGTSRSLAKALNPSCREIAPVLWHPWHSLLPPCSAVTSSKIFYIYIKQKAESQGARRQTKRKSAVTTSSFEGIFFFSWLRKQLGSNC